MSEVKNAKVKAIEIILGDGKARELKFTLNSLAELEDRYGSVDEAFKALEGNSIKAVRCVLWAGLLDSGEDLTERQVGALIDTDNLQDIVGHLGAALDTSMPDKASTDSPQLPNE